MGMNTIYYTLYFVIAYNFTLSLLSTLLQIYKNFFLRNKINKYYVVYLIVCNAVHLPNFMILKRILKGKESKETSQQVTERLKEEIKNFLQRIEFLPLFENKESGLQITKKCRYCQSIFEKNSRHCHLLNKCLSQNDIRNIYLFTFFMVLSNFSGVGNSLYTLGLPSIMLLCLPQYITFVISMFFVLNIVIQKYKKNKREFINVDGVIHHN